MLNTIIIYINFTKSNIFGYLLLNKLNLLKYLTTGILKFKNKKKFSPFAYITLLKNLIEFIPKSFTSLNLTLILKGVCSFRNLIFKCLFETIFNTIVIKKFKIMDLTAKPYNGCRLKKRRKI